MAAQLGYGRFDKFIHWLMAINIMLTLVFAKGMSALPDDERVLEYGDHGASVTTIAICLVIRILWRWYHGFPQLPPSMSDAAQTAARIAHYALYGVLALQIGVGVFLASTTELEFVAALYNINYTAFGLAPQAAHDLLLDFHIALYWTITALLVLHVAAALKHHFVDGDEVLLRMLPFSGRGVSGRVTR